MRKSDLIIESLREVNEAIDVKSLDKKLQKFDKVADKAAFLFKSVAKDMGYDIKKIHLMSRHEWSTFRDKFIMLFNSCDIAWIKGKEWSAEYGVELSGDAYEIVKSIRSKLIDKQWEKVKLSREDIINHFKKYPKANVYIEDGSEFVELSSRDKLLGSKSGSSYQHMGYGSQASTIETGTILYKDKFGNLKVSKYSITWD